jgi:uncharacterized protein YbbC (DUF1343 family)
VHLYPATCLIEGTSLSEGRGTSLPFEYIGHPDLQHDALADDLRGRATARYLYRPTTFVPTFSKHAGTLCRGVQIHTDGDHHPSILALGPQLVAAARRHTGSAFSWVTFGETAFIDRLAGGPELRETVDNDGDVPALLERWATDSDAFIVAMEPDLLYGPLQRAVIGDQG